MKRRISLIQAGLFFVVVLVAGLINVFIIK